MHALTRVSCLGLFVLLLSITIVGQASAQIWPLSGGRALSRDGRWMSPVASLTLSSDESDHKRRGSVDAWDISTPYGAPVYAMGAGQVVYAGCNNAGGYGCWALIDHKNEYTTLYAHMIDEGGGQIWVERGDLVSPWTPLGRVGWTGMTSFGPHVHWEIRHNKDGRIPISKLFPRFQMAYCKFCGPGDDGGGLRTVAGQQVVAGFFALASSRYLILFLLILLALAAIARPSLPLAMARGAGTLMLRGARFSRQRIRAFRESTIWPLAHVVLLILIPSLLCGSTSAVAVWMTDEGLSPREVWRTLRFGLSPLLGPGYQTGLRYTAVWGSPCGQVGTLGKVCSVDDVVDAGLAWNEEVFRVTGSRPSFAVVPRLNAQFGYRSARSLISSAHSAGGLVIIDVAADIEQGEEAIDRLTRSGLDGIAIDIEFADIVTSEEIERLATRFAQRRQEANITGDGVIIIWDVFHNVRMSDPIQVGGIKIIPIFTGYGSTAAKSAGLAISQKLFNSTPADSGLMAFDRRWPINRTCRSPNTERGFDCQDWRTLFSEPEASAVGWWVQQ